MLGRTDSRLRMVAILLIFAVFGTAAGLRLGYWQVVAAPELTADAVRTMTPVKAKQSARADILDRDGVVLAQTASYDSLDAHPSNIDAEEVEGIVDTLDGILSLTPEERSDYAERLTSGALWTNLDDRISHKQSVQIIRAQDNDLLPGISLNPRDVRVYPRKGGATDTSLASHVLGFVRADGRGGEGIERLYDERLTMPDTDGLDLASLEGLPGDLEGLDPEPMRLTLDAKLQRQLERELNTAFIANHAASASAIVMNPHTGAVLAAASVPAYDANDYARIASDDISRLRNRVISDQYEPGSVMKIFTATAALEQGTVTPRTQIADEPKIEFYKYTVWNADKKSRGRRTVKDHIARSRNVVAAKLAKRLAPRSVQRAAHRLFDFWDKVGMTERTGVDIANEAGGSWFDPDEKLWAPVDLANRAFGQGVSVTLLQLARGVSTLVNGGFLVQPHVVADGPAAQVEKERVLKSKVARQALDMMVHVTGSVPWYARGSLIPGYFIGGKTGTAQIWDSSVGNWKEDRWNHSFIGFVGTDRPEVVIAVRLEEPVPLKIEQGSIPLQIEAYELFQMIARASIKHLDIKRSKDPLAGRPIPHTDAAKALGTASYKAAVKKAKQRAKARDKAAAKSAKDMPKAAKGKAAKSKAAKSKAQKSKSSKKASRAAEAKSTTVRAAVRTPPDGDGR